MIIPFNDLWDAYRRVWPSVAASCYSATSPFLTSEYDPVQPRLVQLAIPWSGTRTSARVTETLAKIRPMQVHEDIVVFAKDRQMEVVNPIAKTAKPEGYVGRVNNHGYGDENPQRIHQRRHSVPKSIINIAGTSAPSNGYTHTEARTTAGVPDQDLQQTKGTPSGQHHGFGFWVPVLLPATPTATSSASRKTRSFQHCRQQDKCRMIASKKKKRSASRTD